MMDQVVNTAAPDHDQHFALPDEKDPEVGTDELKIQVNVGELKSEPTPSKEKTKKGKIKGKKEEKKPTKKNKTIWMSILVVTTIVLALSLIIFGLCIAHKLMHASFISALSG